MSGADPPANRTDVDWARLGSAARPCEGDRRPGTARSELLQVPGAVGHAVGFANGAVIKILVDRLTPQAQAAARRQIEGVPVVLEEVGQIHGMPFCSKREGANGCCVHPHLAGNDV